ncbi:MAG: hypothetical protein ABW321_32610 [Polyangiales bacterium]
MPHYSHQSSIFSVLALITGLAGVTACGDDDTPAHDDQPAGRGGSSGNSGSSGRGSAGRGGSSGRGGAGGSDSTPPDASTPDGSIDDAGANEPGDASVAPTGPIVVVTERQSVDTALHYLHILDEWPASGELDYSQAIELGTPGVSRAGGGAYFFYSAEEGSIQKFEWADGKITRGPVIAFSGEGIMGFDPEPTWVSEELAFLIDELSGQVARWNPTTMEIESVVPIDPAALERDGLKGQFQHGLPVKGRLFTAINWRNWDTNTVFPGLALGIFDQDAPDNGPQLLLTDDRCAASVAISPFTNNDGYVYAVGDGAQGFDMIANPNKSPAPQCVVRIKDDGDALDSDWFVDLQEVTGSPAIYMVYPMANGKLLANLWSPDEDYTKYENEASPGWYWELPPYFEYHIIDLEARTSTKVEDLPLAPIQSQKT